MHRDPVRGTPEVLERLLRPDIKGVERLPAATVGSRAAGYRDALVAAGVPLRPEFLSANGFRLQDAVASSRELMMLGTRPTAILAFDAVQSLGVLECFRELGLNCPEDASLVGREDSEWADVVSPPLSVVAQPAYEIGVAACDLLLARISG